MADIMSLSESTWAAKNSFSGGAGSDTLDLSLGQQPSSDDARVCIIGWLGCADIRHKIAHYLLASWSWGSVHPITAAPLPPDMNGENSGEIKESTGSDAVERAHRNKGKRGVADKSGPKEAAQEFKANGIKAGAGKSTKIASMPVLLCRINGVSLDELCKRTGRQRRKISLFRVCLAQHRD